MPARCETFALFDPFVRQASFHRERPGSLAGDGMLKTESVGQAAGQGLG